MPAFQQFVGLRDIVQRERFFDVHLDVTVLNQLGNLIQVKYVGTHSHAMGA